MSTVVVDRVAQRDAALVRANEVRLYRADVKRAVGSLPRSAGLREVAELLDAELLASMRLGELLGSVRGVGRVKVDGLCRVAQAWPGKRLGSLTARQVALLREALLGVSGE